MRFKTKVLVSQTYCDKERNKTGRRIVEVIGVKDKGIEKGNSKNLEATRERIFLVII